MGQVIDGAIGAVPFIVALFVGRLFGPFGVVLGVGGVLWAAFYFLFADGLRGGQSLGKRWIGMHVVSERSGAPCTFGQSFVRNVLLAILGPFDWIFIFGEQHQRLGDKVAGTVVVLD